MRIRQTVAEVRLDHLRSNMRYLQSLLAPGLTWIPMVKADAYGHGAIACAQALMKDNVPNLGVSLVEEGIELRQMGYKGQILIFGSFEKFGEEIGNYKLTPVLSTFHQIEALEAANMGPMDVHIKINTGMNRLGFNPDQLESLQRFLNSSSKYRVTGVLTHLHSAEDALDPQGQTLRQLRYFTQEAPRFNDDPKSWHIWSSTALLLKAEMKKRLGSDWDPRWDLMGARPGLAIYGASAVPDVGAGLKPVMSFRSRIVKVNPMTLGEVAGYGGTFVARKVSRIGVVPVGYADGYHRIVSNRAWVLVNGERAPVVGRISMDYSLVDLTELGPGYDVGAEVVLFGESAHKPGSFMDVNELAGHAGSISWEMLTSVSKRVPRDYKD